MPEPALRQYLKMDVCWFMAYHLIKCLSQLCQLAASENLLDVGRLLRGTFSLRHVCIV